MWGFIRGGGGWVRGSQGLLLSSPHQEGASQAAGHRIQGGEQDWVSQVKAAVHGSLRGGRAQVDQPGAFLRCPSAAQGTAPASGEHG